MNENTAILLDIVNAGDASKIRLVEGFFDSSLIRALKSIDPEVWKRVSVEDHKASARITSTFEHLAAHIPTPFPESKMLPL